MYQPLDLWLQLPTILQGLIVLIILRQLRLQALPAPLGIGYPGDQFIAMAQGINDIHSHHQIFQRGSFHRLCHFLSILYVTLIEFVAAYSI